MESVGVRELGKRADELVRLVREQRQEVEITYLGKVVARLVPAEELESSKARSRATWDRLERLADEISAEWPEGVSAVEAIREQRGDL